ncbi:MAG TPA: protein phosphatase 2C domain-containing protein [Candidatus Binatia bacterium]|nr:protein phosphatase 2C domain-containing protein [Candidatus Binatia bacterium]
MWTYVAANTQGKRDYQEDSYGAVEIGGKTGSLVCVIADGMGGHSGGAIASHAVVRSVLSTWLSPAPSASEDRLREGVAAATRALAACEASDADVEGLGSTLVAVVLTDTTVEWVSVGDSVLWLLRDGQLRRLNEDHSMKPVLEKMVKDGQLTKEEAAVDPQRHHLRSALTKDAPDLVDRPNESLTLRPSDRVILATDGVLTLPEAEVLAVLAKCEDPADAARELIAAVIAKDHRGQDNASVVVAYQRDQQAKTMERGASTAGRTAAPAAAAAAASAARPQRAAAAEVTTQRSRRTPVILGALAAAAVVAPLLIWMVLTEDRIEMETSVAQTATARVAEPAPVAIPAREPAPAPVGEHGDAGDPPAIAAAALTPEDEPPIVESVKGDDAEPATGAAAADVDDDAALTISSRPAGASLFIDGEAVGTADGTRRDVGAGSHAIEVQKNGYRPLKETVRLQAGQSRSLTLTLCKSRLRLACKGSEVWWFDGCSEAEEFERACAEGQECSGGTCRAVIARSAPAAEEAQPAREPKPAEPRAESEVSKKAEEPAAIAAKPVPAASPAAEAAVVVETVPPPGRSSGTSAPEAPATAEPRLAKPVKSAPTQPPATQAGPCANKQAKQRCKGNDIWWYDDCGKPASLAEQCRGTKRCRPGTGVQVMCK